MLLGGATMDGERHHLVELRRQLARNAIERAKRRLGERRFRPVPGETEFIPLPA